MEPTGDALARLILTCRPPYAVCVQGKWGSGKTSLMRYAMARLGGRPLTTVLETSSKQVHELPDDLNQLWTQKANESEIFVSDAFNEQIPRFEPLDHDQDPPPWAESVQIVPIWFNPWQHQNAPVPVVALLHELRQQFSVLLKFWNESSKLSQVAVEAGLSMVGDLIDTFSFFHGGKRMGSLKSPGSKIRDIGEAYERRNFETMHDAQRINLLFREVVARLLQVGNDPDDPPRGRDGQKIMLRRLVIFIDDLDRCAENQTVHLLEAVKLYLQTPHCVFVFGMDSTAARRAVRGQLDQGDEVAREYLEKLFQTTLHVPLPTQRQQFVIEQLRALDVFDSPPPSEDAGDQDSPSEDPGIENLAQQIFTLAEPNPRKLKNFINTLAAGLPVAQKTVGESFKKVRYLLITYLRCYHPDVFRLISYDCDQLELLHKVLSSEEFKSGIASPAEHFFHRAFRHVFKHVTGFDDIDKPPSREDSDAVVDELTERLDRHRSDRVFIEYWKGEFASTDGAGVVIALRLYLQADGDVP